MLQILITLSKNFEVSICCYNRRELLALYYSFRKLAKEIYGYVELIVIITEWV